MEWIIIFAIASAFAVVKGVGSGAGAIRQRYRDHIEPKRSLVRDAIDQGHAGVSVKSGEKLGAAAAATVTGLGLAFRAFGSGMKSGWSQGKDRGRQIVDRHKPVEPLMPDTEKPDTEFAYAGYTSEKGKALNREGLCAWGGGNSPEFCGEPAIQGYPFCPEHSGSYEDQIGEPVHALDDAEENTPEQQRPLRLVTNIQPVQEGTSMSIATQTGGEVLTEEQFEKEMEGVIAEATAELDDAQGDAKRAVEDTNRVEMMSACMASLNIDPSTVAAVRALADTNSARLQNAQARVAAAELRMSAAQKALATFRASAQKTFYAS